MNTESNAPSTDTMPVAAVERMVRQLSADMLTEQRSRRRWNIGLRLAWLALVAFIVYSLSQHANGLHTPQPGPHTALVEVRGEIAADTLASADNLTGALRDAFADSNSQAVVLRLNSPGGSPVQAGLVHDEILRLKALHKKKAYAVVEESAASGAYYIAVAADEIYVDKASIVGSIGVLMDGFGFTGTMDKLGVERRLITAGENKGFLDPFSPMSAGQRAYAEQMLAQIHQQFVTVVKQGRGARLKETPETFSGLFWTGQEAVQQGLADHLGSLDYVAREVIKAENVIDYTPQENVAERLAKRFGAAMGGGAVKALRSTPSLY